jgi:hypothetical protein
MSATRRELTIGDELHMLVERDQGEAFIADDMNDWDAERVLDRARTALQIQRELNIKMANWIRRKEKVVAP